MYYILILLISFPYFFGKQNWGGGSKKYLCYSFMILLIISSLRGYTVGGDLLNYIPLFEDIANNSLKSIFQEYTKYGWIFTIYIKLVSYISSDPTFILFAISLVNIGLVFFFIKRYSCNYWLSIFIYITMAYYTNTFNSVRSSMALAIGMLAIHYLFKNSRWKCLLCSLIAIEIHKTFFPILFIFILKKIWPNWYFLIISICCSILASQVMNLNFFFNAITLYSASYAGVEEAGSGYSLLMLDICLTLGSFFCLRHKLNEKSALLINLLCLATCIQAFAPVFSLTTRMALFFTVYIIILLPDVIDHGFSDNSKSLVTIVLCVLCLAYFQMFVMRPSIIYDDGVISNSQRTIPYYFCWQKTNSI